MEATVKKYRTLINEKRDYMDPRLLFILLMNKVIAK